MTREEAIANLAKSRQALHQAIEGLSEEEKTQVQVEGVWTIKDVIGHLSFWEGALLKPLQSYAEGGTFEADVIADYMTCNDEQAALRRDVPLDAIMDESNTVRQGLVVAANELSAEQLEAEVAFPWGGTGTVAQGLSGMAGHEAEHTRPIREWRQGDTVTG